MRNIITFFLLLNCLYIVPATGQIGYIPAAGHKFSFGFGLGKDHLYGDFRIGVEKPAGTAEINYNVSPYISVGFQGQGGYFSRGDFARNGGTYFNSTFLSLNFNTRFSIGRLFGIIPNNNFTRIIDGIYGGTGFGIIHNIHQEFTYTNPKITPKYEGVLGDDKNAIFYIPVNLGINIDLPQFLRFYAPQFFANIQFSQVLSDRLDYYDPQNKGNKANDSYSLYTAGFRFNFGNVRKLHYK